MAEEVFWPTAQSVNGMDQLMNIRPPTDDESQIIDKLFNNKFTYNIAASDRILPERLFSVPCWLDQELQFLKCNLNEAKSELDNIPIDHWQRHTKRTHLSTEIMRLIRSEFKPLMSTQAWFKFHEILGHYPELVSKDANSFNSVHLCEAPGAFVASLQHFLHSQGRNQTWKWLASTLSPYYEGNDPVVMIGEDIFIRGTWDNWSFGADGTGNIMDDANVEQLQRVCSQRGMDEVHLVTCDGSIDCANDPAEQESIVSQLIFCEVVAGLRLLTMSGSMVVKMFTLFEHSSVCLMYLLCCLFKQVSIIKPVTSKPGNSEVYVVASGFNGIDEALLNQLIGYFGPETPSAAMFDRRDIPSSFLNQHLECCRKFSNFQMQVISTNLELYKAISVNYELALKLQFARHYICRFKVRHVNDAVYRPAEPTCVALKQKRSRNGDKKSGAKGRHSGTLASRRQQILRTVEELVMSKTAFGVSDQPVVSQCLGKCLLLEAEFSSLKPQLGKKFSVLHSSKFCEQRFLEQYLQLLSCLQSRTVAVDDGSILVFSLCHLKELAQSIQTVLVVKPADHALIMDLNERHYFSFEVFSDSCDLEDENSANVFFCGLLAPSQKDDMQHIVDCREEISNLLDILKKIRPGCHCLVGSGPLLTRLRAGLLCLLYSCFEKVFVFASGHSSTLYLVGWNFRGCSLTLESFLGQAFDVASSTSLQNHYTLLEIVPISILYDNDFYKFIIETNNNFIQMRFDHLLQNCKEFYRTARNDSNTFSKVS